MASEHTPGPWSAEDVMGDGSIDICGPDVPGRGSPNLIGCALVDIGSKGFVPRKVGEANARLMAAAPELLEALKTLYAQAELFNSPDDDVWVAVRDQALAAIAKAEVSRWSPRSEIPGVCRRCEHTVSRWLNEFPFCQVAGCLCDGCDIPGGPSR